MSLAAVPQHTSPRVSRLNLFPVMGSIQEVRDFAVSQLPITNKNDLLNVLGRYHNTLLAEIKKDLTEVSQALRT